MQDRFRPTSLDPATDESGLVEAVQLEDPDAAVKSEQDRAVLSSEFMSGTLISAGVLIATIVLLRNTRKIRRRRANEPDETPAERLSDLRTNAARDGVHEMQAARAAEVARHYAALIDNKIEHLEQVITDAERAIERLEAATQQARLSPEVQPPQSIEHSPDARTIVPETSHAPEPTTLGPPASERPEPLTPQTTNSTDPMRNKVFELADQGLAPVEIAKQVGTHTGKVELILALRNAAG